MEVGLHRLAFYPRWWQRPRCKRTWDIVGAFDPIRSAHGPDATRIGSCLKANGQGHVKVFVGGIIPDEDVPRLFGDGRGGSICPGTLTDDIVTDVRRAVAGESGYLTPYGPGHNRAGG